MASRRSRKPAASKHAGQAGSRSARSRSAGSQGQRRAGGDSKLSRRRRHSPIELFMATVGAFVLVVVAVVLILAIFGGQG